MSHDKTSKLWKSTGEKNRSDSIALPVKSLKTLFLGHRGKGMSLVAFYFVCFAGGFRFFSCYSIFIMILCSIVYFAIVRYMRGRVYYNEESAIL